MTEERTTDEIVEPSFSKEVGRRLRAVRRLRRLSLDEVERRSEGRWSASAVGAYERGFRNLSLPRLRGLAAFYEVPMTVLLGEIDLRGTGEIPMPRLVLDLAALEAADDADPVLRYVHSIIVERGDPSMSLITVRRDDVRALCVLLGLDEPELVRALRSWGALVEAPPASTGTSAEAEPDRVAVGGR